MVRLVYYCFCIVGFTSLNACLPSLDDPFECSSPKTGTLSGIALDNYTKLPVEAAEIHFSNFKWDAAPGEMTINSDANGQFSYTDTGCTFANELLLYRSANHPNYSGAAGWTVGDETLLHFYKERPIKLIFENTLIFEDASNEISYEYSYCITPKSTCFRTKERGEFVGGLLDTITIHIAEGEVFEVKYRVNENDSISESIPSEGIDEYVIKY